MATAIQRGDSLSWEADSSLAGEISFAFDGNQNSISLSWSRARDSVLSCTNPVHGLTFSFLVIYFHIILKLKSGSFKLSLSF
jgi:hypothetical protein